MPSHSGSFEISIGPILNITVAQPGSINPVGPAPSHLASFPGLLDTGATITCITLGLAESVGLQPIGKIPMYSATGAVAMNFYLVDLILPLGGIPGLVIPKLQVLEFNANGGPMQMLVGRDVLCLGVFTMSFDGHFTLSL